MDQKGNGETANQFLTRSLRDGKVDEGWREIDQAMEWGWGGGGGGQGAGHYSVDRDLKEILSGLDIPHQRE